MNNVDFYFSIGSTYTYLSVTRILDVEKKHNMKFNWKPFSVRAIMKEMNNIPFPKDKKNKVDYMWRDIERRAKGYGFFAKTPVPYPLSEFDLANQIAILGLNNGWGIDYVKLTYKKGLDKYYGLIELGEEAGIFKKVSTRYEMPDGTKVFGKSINTDPEKYYTKEILKKIFLH